MKLIALLAGLLIERLATQLFHLRQLRWLDSIIDAGFARAQRLAGVPPLLSVLVLATLLVLPLVFVLTLFGDVLFDFGFLLIAIVVLFFSLGPKDIGEEVDDYCISLEKGDEELIRQTAKALLEDEPSDDRDTLVRDVEAAVCIQSNNRLFAVIFWFVLLGPIGAWSYRVTDLIRRRAVFNAVRCES
ncbi:MAG: regulatory signaling modulator protein AmpE, partial [Pseudomonadota bacterium]